MTNATKGWKEEHKEACKDLLEQVQSAKDPLEEKRIANNAELDALLNEFKPKEDKLRSNKKALDSQIGPLDQLRSSIMAISRIKDADLAAPSLKSLIKKVEALNGDV